MPYVDQKRRAALDPQLKPLLDFLKNSKDVDAGDLNYAITRILWQFVQSKGLRYEHVNSVMGVLECAKQEFYRRVAAPYEDKKIRGNGDVYV